MKSIFSSYGLREAQNHKNNRATDWFERSIIFQIAAGRPSFRQRLIFIFFVYFSETDRCWHSVRAIRFRFLHFSSGWQRENKSFTVEFQPFGRTDPIGAPLCGIFMRTYGCHSGSRYGWTLIGSTINAIMVVPNIKPPLPSDSAFPWSQFLYVTSNSISMINPPFESGIYFGNSKYQKDFLLFL